MIRVSRRHFALVRRSPLVHDRRSADDLVEHVRAHKDPAEVRAIRHAGRIAEEAFERLLPEDKRSGDLDQLLKDKAFPEATALKDNIIPGTKDVAMTMPPQLPKDEKKK